MLSKVFSLAIILSTLGACKNVSHYDLSKSKKEAQATFAQLNLEFPVVENVKLDPITKKWGEFKQNTTFHLNKAGEFQKNAIKLMQEVNYR